MERREPGVGGTLVTPLPAQLRWPLLSVAKVRGCETADSCPNPALHTAEKRQLASPLVWNPLYHSRKRKRERRTTPGEPQVYQGRQSRDLLMRYDGKCLMTPNPASDMEWKAQVRA